MVDEVQESAFAGTGRTDHGDHIACTDDCTKILDGRYAVKALGKVLDDQQLPARFKGRCRPGIGSSFFCRIHAAQHALSVGIGNKTPKELHCSNQQIREQEVNDCRCKEREEGIIGAAADDIRHLGQIHHRNVARNGGHLDHGYELSAEYGQNVLHRLRENDLEKALHFRETERCCGTRLSPRNGFDAVAEDLRGIGSKIQREANDTHPERRNGCLIEDDVIEHHEHHHQRDALEEAHIEPCKRSQIAVTAHAQRTDQDPQGGTNETC